MVTLEEKIDDAPTELDKGIEVGSSVALELRPEGEPTEDEESVGNDLAMDENPTLGSVVTESDEHRSARQRRSPRTYVLSYENKRYTEVAGVVTFSLQHRRYDMKRWLQTVHGFK